MNLKVQGRKIGRKIHRETGIPFPAAMRMGKLFARGRQYDVPKDEFYKSVSFPCGDECCGFSHWQLAGPKGTIDLDSNSNIPNC